MDNKNKCICWLRGSTDRQEIDSQRKDLTRIATEKEGFLPENIIYIGKAGASAIKQNDLYMQEVNELLSTLDKDSTVKTVFVWEISRLARVELAFYKLKDYFTKNKIQLICQTPLLRLYDADGTINQGTEITLSLLITLAKQEMEIKQARFKRGRDKAREEGKFGGGAHGAMYGYMVDENGYIVPNPTEVKNIIEIFNLYSTGNYSTYTLSEELKKRGFTTREGTITFRWVQKILSNTAYIGFKGKRKYPPIVDTALFEKVAKIRENKDTIGVHTTKETRHIHFGIKHLICKQCGNNMIALGPRYCCYKHFKRTIGEKCDCTDGISIKWFDKIIWEVAQLEHITYLQDRGKENIQDYEKQIAVLNEKIVETQKRIDNLQIRRERIQELYMGGDITKVKYDAQKGKLTIDYTSYLAELERYHNEIDRIETIIEQIKNPTPDALLDLVASVQDEISRKRIKEIIDFHIGNCTIENTVFGKYKATEIVINTHNGTEYKYMFCYGAKKVFKWNSYDKRWIDENPEREKLREEVDKVFESMGTTLEEITQQMINEDKIADILNDENLTDNEKQFLISVIVGKDIREE